MKGDFTRTTFDAARRFSRVLMQQGRVTIDADANEQTDILLHYLRTLAADLIGPYAAPAVDGGFALGTDANGQLTIGAGRYYVDGILVENDQPCLYSAQPHYRLPTEDGFLAETRQKAGHTLFVYLDVWERHVTHVDVPAIRDVALGGPDTSSRSQVVWQVKAVAIRSPTSQQVSLGQLRCTDPLKDLVTLSPAALAVRLESGGPSANPGASPAGSYRGTGNHFYRVEIHTPGKAGTATFKWSRDNGSVVTAWLGTDDHNLIVGNSRGFLSGCWVELIDEETELHGRPGTLVKLAKVAEQTLTVDPSSITTEGAIAWSDALIGAKVRRWDQTESAGTKLESGAVAIVESTAPNAEWLDLEHGIQVQFSPAGEYRTGDYWTIPARAVDGSIEWPENGTGEPKALAPFGIEHHYAPLGYVRWDGKELKSQRCDLAFTPLSDRLVNKTASD